MKVVAMVPVFNEEDIIEESLSHLIAQGVEPVVLDTGSTDDTYAICEAFQQRGQITLAQRASEYWDLAATLRALYDMALLQCANWVMVTGADQLPETDVHNVTLKEGIGLVDGEGYNLIQFGLFDFFMTNRDDESCRSIKTRLTYYSFQHDLNFSAWKIVPGIGVEFGAGHWPVFPNGHKYKISPRRFVHRHYPLRSPSQARRKIAERMHRNRDTVETRLGWHTHYREMKQQDVTARIDYRCLTRYVEGDGWNWEKKFSFCPSNMEGWKRDDLFTPDGDLKMRPKTSTECWLMLKMSQERVQALEEHSER